MNKVTAENGSVNRTAIFSTHSIPTQSFFGSFAGTNERGSPVFSFVGFLVPFALSHHHGRRWNRISVRRLSRSITVLFQFIRSTPSSIVENPDVPPLATRKISTAGFLHCVLRLLASSSSEHTSTQQPNHPHHRRTRTHSHHVRAASGEETAAAAPPLDPQRCLSHCFPLVRLFQLLFTLSAVPAFFLEYTRQ